MTHPSVFSIVYTHQITGRSDNSLVEQAPTVSFQIDKSAITTGWLGDNFRSRRGDFIVLVTIGLHARPLEGADLDLLKGLGLVTEADRGRLYARVTDVALADILKADHKNISDAADRLAGSGLIHILQLPKNFCDSRGRFAGNRAYLLDGGVLNLLSASGNRRGVIHPTVPGDRGAIYPTVTPRNGPDRGAFCPTKILPSAFTPADAGGPQGGPAAASPSALNAGNRTHQLTPAASGNGQRDSRAETTAEAAPDSNSFQGQLDRLNAALDNPQTLTSFEVLVENVETRVGLTAVGFSAASLGLMPLPERRRRVLDDLRRMQARGDLTPSQRKSKVYAILAQNIGVTLGLGLEPNGCLRIAPVKADYAAIGGLAGEYGAENVWVTACEIAGAAIEGDPLDYLRAALSRTRERTRNSNDRKGTAAKGGYGPCADLDGLTGQDYLTDFLGSGAITPEQAERDYGALLQGAKRAK